MLIAHRVVHLFIPALWSQEQVYPINKAPTAILPNVITVVETFPKGGILALLTSVDPDNNLKVNIPTLTWLHHTR